MCVRTTIYKIDKVLLAGAQCQIMFKMFFCSYMWGDILKCCVDGNVEL